MRKADKRCWTRPEVQPKICTLQVERVAKKSIKATRQNEYSESVCFLFQNRQGSVPASSVPSAYFAAFQKDDHCEFIRFAISIALSVPVSVLRNKASGFLFFFRR